MITLPFPTYSRDDLPHKPLFSSPRTFEQFDKAVQAYAWLYDPLAFLRGANDQDDEVTQLADAVSWLASRAALLPTEGDRHEAWLHNVRTLARKHIRANYQQGREGGHPVFTLKFVPVNKANDDEYQPHILQKAHWSSFVKAVQAQDWLNLADKVRRDELNVDLETYEACKVIVWGASYRLANAYPTLGQHDVEADSFTHCSSQPEGAMELWERNISDAAKVYAAHYGVHAVED